MSFIGSRLCLFGSNFFTANASRLFVDPLAVQVRYAARKGTRERKEKKKKVKVVEEKVGFIPHNQRNKEKMLASRPKLKYDDSWKKEPTDDVYYTKYYRWKVYPFAEAIRCHKETHHPDIYNKPDSRVHVTVELNMQAEKKNKFLDNFSRIVAVPHPFDHGEARSVLVFGKTQEIQEEAREAGAQLAGGVELIKEVHKGSLSLQDFQFVVAHPDILSEMVVLKGLMKKRFPNVKNGTLDVDVGGAVERFVRGISYTGKKDEHEKDFGLVETVIGTLSMDAKELEENFTVLIRDLYTLKPKREGGFISRCLLLSPPSSEKLKIDHNLYLVSAGEEEAEDDEEEVGESVAL